MLNENTVTNQANIAMMTLEMTKSNLTVQDFTSFVWSLDAVELYIEVYSKHR